MKQTDTQLVFNVKSPKEVLYIYWAILIVVNIFFATAFAMIYGLGATMWIFFVLFSLDLIYLKDTNKTYTITIDKSKGALEIRKNDTVIYTSDYPLQEIQYLKTVVGPNYWTGEISSLVIVLRNNHEEVVDTSYGSKYRRLPFYIDIHANTQANIAKEIAKFLVVSYKDSEYTNSSFFANE